MGDVRANCVRIEHLAKIDREDQQHDEPSRNMLTEQLNADKLARIAEDGGAHEGYFGNAEPIVHSKRAEQDGEWRRRDHGQHAQPRTFLELT